MGYFHSERRRRVSALAKLEQEAKRQKAAQKSKGGYKAMNSQESPNKPNVANDVIGGATAQSRALTRKY
jgi:hypothetical protein